MAGTRKQIPEAFTVALLASAALDVLTGRDGADPRVYASRGSDPKRVTDTYPAYVLVEDAAKGGMVIRHETFNMQVTAYAKGRNRARDMQDAFDVALNNAQLAVSGWTLAIKVRRTLERSIYDPTAGLWQGVNTYSCEVF